MHKSDFLLSLGNNSNFGDVLSDLNVQIIRYSQINNTTNVEENNTANKIRVETTTIV
ncbi:MAG TPA: hypothetical protein VJ799_09055 [Nitrososphaeraceae archaeon]|nr:hypothetical protein [Nitrososphaeraceae archaeon]